MSPVQPADIEQLRKVTTGRVVTDADSDYDEIRAGFNGMIDRRPAAILRVVEEEDVWAGIAFAREHDLPLAIRAGGHSAPGFGCCDDGIVLDVRELTATRVDPGISEIRCGSGLTWKDFDAATQEYGLAVTGGRVSSTGVTGLTIGSGSGWLERTMGLTSDSLIGGRMVTADGEVVQVEDDPDLLWALRGGGGNFGVLTELRFALRPVGPIVLGGIRLFPIERARDVMAKYRDIMESAPQELCGGISLMHAPLAPFVPDELRGKPVAIMLVLWAGELEDAAANVAVLDAVGEPAVDLVQPMPYAALQQMLDAGSPPGHRDYFKGGFISQVSDDAIDAIVGLGEDLRAPLTQVIIAPLGAHTNYASFGPDHSAIGHRDEAWSFQVLSLWQDAAEDEMQRAWTRAASDTMSSYSDMVSYPNFLAADEAGDVKQAYEPGVLEKLREVKAKYDPENVFRLNHNIAPAAAAQV